MNHAAVTASRCDSCHNGSYTGQGTTGAQGTASFPGHVATNGQDCSTCHKSTTSFAGGRVHPRGDRHQLLELPQRHDRDRHDDAAAHPDRRRPVQQLPHQHGGELHHLHDEPRGGERQPLRLLPQRLLHEPGHHGRAGHGVVPRPRGDQRPGLLDLPQEHDQLRRARTFAHAATDTNCSSCHNGTTATGMTTPPHIPTGTLQCSNCHANTAASFTTYTMSHAAVSGSRCDSCHNGSYTSQGTTGAQGTASFSGHVPTNGQDCVDLPQEHDQLRGRRLHPRGDRHQLLELPQRHHRDRHDDAAAHPDRDAPVQQLPHQHGGELHHLHDEPFGGQREPLRRLPQRLLYQPGHQGRARHGVVPGPRRDQRPGLLDLPQEHDQLRRRDVRPFGERHQLRELPQRHDRDRHDHAAAHPDRDDPVQQLPHQHGGELHDLHDEPHGGRRAGLQLLPQRLLHQPRHQGRAGKAERPSQDDGRLRDMPQHDKL